MLFPKGRETDPSHPRPLRTKILCLRFPINWKFASPDSGDSQRRGPPREASTAIAREREWKTTRPETHLEGRRRFGVRSLPTSFNDPNLSLGSAAISIWRTSGRLTLPAPQSEQAD